MMWGQDASASPDSPESRKSPSTRGTRPLGPPMRRPISIMADGQFEPGRITRSPVPDGPSQFSIRADNRVEHVKHGPLAYPDAERAVSARVFNPV